MILVLCLTAPRTVGRIERTSNDLLVFTKDTALIKEVADAVVHLAVVRSSRANAFGRIQTVLHVILTAIEQPLQDCGAVLRTSEDLFQVFVLCLLIEVLIELDDPNTVRGEHGIIGHGGKMVGVEPKGELRYEGERAFKQVTGDEGVTTRHGLHARRIQAHILRGFSHGHKACTHELCEGGLRGIEVGRPARFALTDEIGGSGISIVFAEHRTDGGEQSTLAVSGLRAVGDEHTFLTVDTEDGVAQSPLQECGLFLITAHDLVDVGVPPLTGRREEIRQGAGGLLGDIERDNVFYDLTRFQVVGMAGSVEQVGIGVHILQRHTHHGFQNFHDIAHRGELSDGLDVLVVVINELVFFFLILGLDLFAVEHEQVQQGLQTVGDRTVLTLFPPTAIPNVPEAVLRTEANGILIYIAHQGSHTNIIPSVDIALMGMDAHQRFHDLGHTLIFDDLSVRHFVVHVISPHSFSFFSTSRNSLPDFSQTS